MSANAFQPNVADIDSEDSFEQAKLAGKSPATLSSFVSKMRQKTQQDVSDAIFNEMEAWEEDKIDESLSSIIPRNFREKTQDEIEELFQGVKENQSFRLTMAEGDGASKLMTLAAKYPKRSLLTGFSFGKNYDLKTARESLPVNTKGLMQRATGWAKTSKYTRIKDLCISYRPNVSSHSKRVGQVMVFMIDARLSGKEAMIRTARISSHLDTSVYMSMDYFVPTKDFSKISVMISCSYTGVQSGETYASVWLHGNLEHTDNSYQSAIVSTHATVSIPTSTLLGKNAKDPTKYNAFVSSKALSSFRQEYNNFSEHRTKASTRGSLLKPFRNEHFEIEDDTTGLPMYDAVDDVTKDYRPPSKYGSSISKEETDYFDSLEERKILSREMHPIAEDVILSQEDIASAKASMPIHRLHKKFGTREFSTHKTRLIPNRLSGYMSEY